MSEFLLLHDNESGGKSAIFTKLDDGETMILEAKESVEEIYNMLND